MSIPPRTTPGRDALYSPSEIEQSKTIVENFALISNGGERGTLVNLHHNYLNYNRLTLIFRLCFEGTLCVPVFGL